MTHTLQWSSTA